MVRAAGLEPARDYSQRIFIPLRLSSPSLAWRRVRGLDYPFTKARAVGATRLVSTPSRNRAWLGIGIDITTVSFPRIWAVLLPPFPTGHSKSISPLRLPLRHARTGFLLRELAIVASGLPGLFI